MNEDNDERRRKECLRSYIFIHIFQGGLGERKGKQTTNNSANQSAQNGSPQQKRELLWVKNWNDIFIMQTLHTWQARRNIPHQYAVTEGTRNVARHVGTST